MIDSSVQFAKVERVDLDNLIPIDYDTSQQLIPEDTELDHLINNCQESKTNLFCFILAMGNAADAVEIMCVGYILNEMDDTTTAEREFLSAAVFIGMLFGGLLCGIMSDRIGRKPSLQYSLLLNAIAGLASAAAPSLYWLIAFRIVGGIGIGGSVPSVFTLGAEIFPAHIRGKYLSVVAW
jgi:MFS family permease